MYRRGKTYYVENSTTGKQESLRTSDAVEAQRILAAKNEAANNSKVTLAVGKAYLAVTDPEMLTRTWSEAIQFVVRRGGHNTQDRARRAYQSASFDRIRNKAILETTSADFLAVLSDGKQSTSHYLKLLHSSAVDLGWLAGRLILARKCWPKIAPKQKRSISWDEHSKLVSAERNQELRLYLEILWETGASQSDAARLSNSNVNWASRTIVYHRAKTGEQASISIGARLETILRQLPSEGFFFPKLIEWSCTDRAAKFNLRCKTAGIKGVSLHSYRYAWAERAFAAGYPERFAQAALGHGSRAIHHAYARGAKVNCPALENYESKIVPLPSANIA